MVACSGTKRGENKLLGVLKVWAFSHTTGVIVSFINALKRAKSFWDYVLETIISIYLDINILNTLYM